jgi:hypothetical protein
LKNFVKIFITISVVIAVFAACGSEDVPTAATGEPNVITAATVNAQDTAANAGAQDTANANAGAQNTGANANTNAQDTQGTAAPQTTTEAATTMEPDEEVIQNAEVPGLAEEIVMPLPYGDYVPEVEATRDFYFPFVPKLDGVPMALIQIVPGEELDIWISDDIVLEEAQTSVYQSKNIVSFISDFGLSDKEVKKAMELFYENTDPQILTGGDVDVIISGDEAAINKRFASDLSIVKGDKIYPPSWVYENSYEAIKAVGITPEELTAKLKFYKELSITDEAKKALTDKVNGYKG